jgi:L-asparaginase
MQLKNDVYILYKQSDSTRDVVTKFKNKLIGLEDKNVATLGNLVIKDYNDGLSAEESYLEGNMSFVLLCFIDDEFFYDSSCCAIWSAFMNRQRNTEPQLVFPVLIEDVVTTNFDISKKSIYLTAKRLGFYSMESEKEAAALCSDITENLQKIDKEGDWGRGLGDATTNVHDVCAVGSSLIENFKVANQAESRSERERLLEIARSELAADLSAGLKAVNELNNRKYISRKGSNDASAKGVCVLYTGGTAGMIHETGSLELIQASLEQLILKLPGLKREQFEIDFYSFAEPLDSSNILSAHWLVMAEVIATLKDNYQGFVIIHGANTMAYSAAALSFLLDNVDRPIILTGSELGLTVLNTDAEQNIQRSVEIAAYQTRGEENVRDVCILFGRRLIRGNRSTKQIALDTAEGFYSPNYSDLASVSRDRVVIDSSQLKPPVDGESNKDSKILVNHKMASKPKIVICDIYPDMDMEIFKQSCNRDNVGAVIIKTYGTGGIPSDDETFIECLEDLYEANKIVVNLTQCPKGNVELRIFETNATLFNLGVISGGDMVTEAAYCKLKHLFSKFEEVSNPKEKAEYIRHYMMVSMRGELTMSTFTLRFTKEGKGLTVPEGSEGVTLVLSEMWNRNPARKYINDDEDYSEDTFAKFDKNAHITSAFLRLSEVQVSSGNRKAIPSPVAGLTQVELDIVVSLSNKVAPSGDSIATPDKSKFTYDDKNKTIDINVDVSRLANSALQPPCKLYSTIWSKKHKLEIGSVQLILSVAQKKRG